MYKFIDLFAGIGGFHLALKTTAGGGGANCLLASEINPDAQKTYALNFPNTKILEDIIKIPSESIPQHDILCAGFPCQAFSIAGNQRGFKDIRGVLFFEVVRIAQYHKPSVLFLENVKNLKNHNNGETLVCQDNGKALMTNPNSALSQWLLRKILKLRPKELLTLEKLQELGFDSVIISKKKDIYTIDVMPCESYENFVEHGGIAP